MEQQPPQETQGNQKPSQQDDVPMRLLKIKTLTDTVYELNVPANMLIKDLRLKLQEISGVPADRQRMICMGQQLNDAKTVADYAKEATGPNWIHLIAKPQAATTQESTTNQQQQQQQQQPQNRNNGNFDMFGGNVQIQSGSVGDLSSLLGNITNLFNLPNNLRGGQQQQQAGNSNQIAATINTAVTNLTNQLTNPLQNNNNNNVQQPQHSSQQQQQQQAQTQNVRSNLVGNQQPIQIQRQIQLPHQELMNLGLICNNLMGAQSTFPGPPLPQAANRNAAELIGSYLSNWQFQVQRTLPFVHRLAELLQREPLMTLTEDRNSTQALAQEVGRALNELTACTQPIGGLLRDIQLNSAPGQVRIQPNSNQNNLTRPQVQSNTNVTSIPLLRNQNAPQANSNPTNTHVQVGQPVISASISLGQQNISNLLNNPLLQQAQRNATSATTTSASQSQQNQATTTANTASNSQPATTTNTTTANNNNNGATASITINANNNTNNTNVLNDLIQQISGAQNGEVRIGVMNQSLDNNSEIQIVGIGSTHVVDGDDMNLQSVLSNLIGNSNANVNINGVRQNNNNNNSNAANNNNNNQSSNNEHQDDEWEDEVDENAPLGIEVSSIINVNGVNMNGQNGLDNNFLQNLLSGIGLPSNASVNISSNLPSVSTTTISGSQAANLLAQLNRQNQPSNASQSQQSNSTSNASTTAQQTTSSAQSQNQANQHQQQQNQVNEVAQQQQQQQPLQANPLMMMLGGGGNSQGGFNPLSLLMGGGGGLGGIMNMTVDELIRENASALENEESTQADQIFVSIIGQLRITDLVSAFMSGQFNFLNGIQQKIRDQITSRNLEKQEFAETLAEQLSQYLIIPEQFQSLVYDGLEPHMIAQDILETRLTTIYDIIFRDFAADGVERFSDEIVYELKQIAGELFSEVSECLIGGLDDLEKIFRAWVNEPITRILGEGTQGLVDSLITSMLWDKIKRLVLTHKHEAENNQARQVEEQKRNDNDQNENKDSNEQQGQEQKSSQNKEEQEIDLLEDIENELEKDQTRFDRYQNVELSQEYKKGDFMKKE